MTNLKELYKELKKEERRIFIMNSTKYIDVDFMRLEIKKAKARIKEIQLIFDNN